MPLSSADRIVLIRETATLLDRQEWADIDLILSQFEVEESYSAKPDRKYDYVVRRIGDARDEVLTGVHDFVVSDASSATSSTGPWSGNKLRLFCSHLARHKAEVGQVAEALTRYGVEAFVAHDAIEPSKQWAAVIEAALSDCDAMIVFLRNGFVDSHWCDQEVGWALGRRRPVLPLKYDEDPYGFLGRLQAKPIANLRPSQVAEAVMEWLSKTPSLHAALAPGLVDAFVHSTSWNFTRILVPLLERIKAVSDDGLNRMEQAAKVNVNVRECGVNNTLTGPEWVALYVAQRRGTTVSGLDNAAIPASW